jgi:dihydrodipicolinate synthase/N-acetylneuraminate lyase
MVTVRTDAKVLATSVVPWTEDWAFDEARFRSQVRAQLSAGLTDLYVFGTAGEGYAVSDAQFATVTKAFVEETNQGGGRPMVGVVSLSTTTVIERIQTARDLGVRRFQISMPSWAALGDGEVDAFFEEVLGSFRDLEFLHYNVARAKRQLTGVEYGRLATRHPNLVATKQSGDSMRQIATSLEEAPQLRHYFVDGGYAYGSLIGDCGLLPSLAICNPERLHSYVADGESRNVDRLLATQRELRTLAGGLLATVGPRSMIDGAYDKVVWKLHDREFPLRLLPPYEYAPDDTADRFASWIADHVPTWVPSERRSDIA